MSKAACLLVLLLFALTSQQTVALEKINTLIVVPNSTGAAKKIYNQVVAGLLNNDQLNINILRLDRDTKAATLYSEIIRRGSDLVISVGNKGYKLSSLITESLPPDIIIVAGGISGKPNGIPTLSLTGDPETSIKLIKRMAPKVKDIRIVYNDLINGWWYEQAQTIAEEEGLKLIGYRAEDLKQGVKFYEQLLKEANPKTSAVWIPLKSIVPSKTILPLLLEKAWAKKLPVISNNPSHTKLGGLMALYPEHYAMGQQLADFAIAHYRKSPPPPKIAGTKNLRIAINLRTSSHLGLRFNSAEQKLFDKIFPTNR